MMQNKHLGVNFVFHNETLLELPRFASLFPAALIAESGFTADHARAVLKQIHWTKPRSGRQPTAAGVGCLIGNFHNFGPQCDKRRLSAGIDQPARFGSHCLYRIGDRVDNFGSCFIRVYPITRLAQ
ncbi:hypothetical protein R6Y99_05170 [Pseudomonas lundensis]|nr:hypothetical protein [Pseudomonas lundensis]